jgi:hypothetical protein
MSITGSRHPTTGKRTGPGLFLVLFPSLLSVLCSCAYTNAPKLVGTPALDGTWYLADIRCASGGKLGEIGAMLAYTVHRGAQEEFYEVNDGAFTWHVRERDPAGPKSAYCETTLTGTWTADGRTLTSSGATFEKREGKGGYLCYEPFQHPRAEKSAAHIYELGGDRLAIHHKNPVIGKRRGCDDGADLVYVFERR